MMRILLIEDDEILARNLQAILSQENYMVDWAADGEMGWKYARSSSYNLIVLDVMLPKLDGISLCKQLRFSKLKTPILLLTARDTSADIVTGLNAGADEYCIKPIDSQEFIARIQAILRRETIISSPVFEWGNLRLDTATLEVYYGNQQLQLTPKEYSILELLMRNGRRVFSRSLILDNLWSFNESPGEHTVRAHIKGLRQKLKAAGADKDLIETVYGLGYRMKPLENIGNNITEVAITEKDLEIQPGSTTPLPENLPIQKLENLQPQAIKETTAYRPETSLLKQAVAQVWERFKGNINERVEVLEQVVRIWPKTDKLSPELREKAIQESHKLAGSLGTFGIPKGSQLAREIEQILQIDLVKDTDTFNQLSSLVKALRWELEHNNFETETKTNRFLIISADTELADNLINLASCAGIQAISISSLSAAKAVLQVHVDRGSRDNLSLPQAILLDLSSFTDWEEALKLLGTITFVPPIPALVLADEDKFNYRLVAARLGGHTFLHKPIAPEILLQTITQILHCPPHTTARVLVVDNDRQILDDLCNELSRWGMQVNTLDDPLYFWDTLATFLPDLLILDLEMNSISGIELCRVVRNDPRWRCLPVLFLTNDNNADTIYQIFAAGADDYVSKPIIAPELVSRILNRLERLQLARYIDETDTLTGVSNRRKSISEINNLISLANRYSQPLCLVVFQLRDFKQVNDRYGHAVGDRVLRRLGQLLRQAFRNTDIVARWGGAEFVVGIYGSNKQNGKKLITEVLATLHQESFTAPQAQFHIILNAGCAQYPDDGAIVQSLYRTASAALTSKKNKQKAKSK